MGKHLGPVHCGRFSKVVSLLRWSLSKVSLYRDSALYVGAACKQASSMDVVLGLS